MLSEFQLLTGLQRFWEVLLWRKLAAFLRPLQGEVINQHSYDDKM